MIGGGNKEPVSVAQLHELVKNNTVIEAQRLIQYPEHVNDESVKAWQLWMSQELRKCASKGLTSTFYELHTCNSDTESVAPILAPWFRACIQNTRSKSAHHSALVSKFPPKVKPVDGWRTSDASVLAVLAAERMDMFIRRVAEHLESAWREYSDVPVVVTTRDKGIGLLFDWSCRACDATTLEKARLKDLKRARDELCKAEDNFDSHYHTDMRAEYATTMAWRNTVKRARNEVEKMERRLSSTMPAEKWTLQKDELGNFMKME